MFLPSQFISIIFFLYISFLHYYFLFIFYSKLSISQSHFLFSLYILLPHSFSSFIYSLTFYLPSILTHSFISLLSSQYPILLIFILRIFFSFSSISHLLSIPIQHSLILPILTLFNPSFFYPSRMSSLICFTFYLPSILSHSFIFSLSSQSAISLSLHLLCFPHFPLLILHLLSHVFSSLHFILSSFFPIDLLVRCGGLTYTLNIIFFFVCVCVCVSSPLNESVSPVYQSVLIS